MKNEYKEREKEKGKNKKDNFIRVYKWLNGCIVNCMFIYFSNYKKKNKNIAQISHLKRERERKKSKTNQQQ
jgi:hypothetical protein